MSAFGGNADMAQCTLYLRKQTSVSDVVMSALCQKRTYAAQQKPSLFDHLVRPREQRGWHVQAEGSCGRQVDDELEFARLNHRQVGRLLAFEDAAGIDTGLPKALRQVRTIGHQTTGFRIVPRVVDAWQAMARREGSDLDAPAEEKGVGSDHERVAAAAALILQIQLLMW